MTQSVTTKVVDGNLRVQLVPSTTAVPAGAYSVTYNSDGRIQFQERWAVPSSSQPLRVRDVRTAASNATAAPETIGPIAEADVVGLIADLGARPSKGSSFAAGRVAMVNSTGLLESVSGAATDCVRVDGSSGPCGALPPSFVDGDSPAGIVDGANAVFSISAAPDPVSSLAVYRNGLLQKLASDYTFSGRTVEFLPAAIPQPGDTLLASYRLGGSGYDCAAGLSDAARLVQRDGRRDSRDGIDQRRDVRDRGGRAGRGRSRGDPLRLRTPGSSGGVQLRDSMGEYSGGAPRRSSVGCAGDGSRGRGAGYVGRSLERGVVGYGAAVGNRSGERPGRL